MERKASVYAAEGTAAHALAESILMDKDDVQVGQTMQVEGFDISITDDMRQNVLVYTDECEVLAEDADWVAVEQRVFLDGLWGNEQPPEPMFGTGDFMCVAGDTAYLRDLKYGKGVGVEVMGNTQLMYYGIGMYYALPEELREKVKEFDLGIVQPRFDHPDGHVRSLKISTDDLRDWASNELKPIVDDIAAGITTFVPGAWCRWCPLSGSCKALAQHNQVIARTDFDGAAAPVSPDTLSNREIGDVLEALPVITAWINSVRAEALARMERDDTCIPNWKLVPKRTIRKWTDEQQVLNILVGLGIKAKDVAEVKVGTVAAIEKVLKQNPEAFKSISHLIDGTSSGVNIAPVKDPRKAVEPTDRSGAEFDVVG
jgi:hypothetical protein